MMPHFWSKPLEIMLLLSNKWAVSSGGSAVHAIRAAVPSNVWAAASGALGSITLLVGSHLHKLLFLGNKWAVSGSGSAVHSIGAAVPSNIGAASSRALSSITLFCFWLGQFDSGGTGNCQNSSKCYQVLHSETSLFLLQFWQDNSMNLYQYLSQEIRKWRLRIDLMAIFEYIIFHLRTRSIQNVLRKFCLFFFVNIYLRKCRKHKRLL